MVYLYFTDPHGNGKHIICYDILEAYNTAKNLKQYGCTNIYARTYKTIKF